VKRTAMSSNEVRRVEVFSRVQSEGLLLRDAAEMLALSYRQIKRLWRRYRQEGPSGLRHRSAGWPRIAPSPRCFASRCCVPYVKNTVAPPASRPLV